MKNEIINILDKNQYITFASINNNRIKARTVDYVNNGINIGFFTWNYTNKIDDILANNKTALCVNNIQVEGYAYIDKNILKNDNEIINNYKIKLPEIYDKFINLKDICFIIIKPILFIMMSYENNKLFLDYLEIEKNIAYRTELSDW